jgi:Skp family chaperone for outer membrane proteins
VKKQIFALVGLSLACGLAAPVQATEQGAPPPAQSAAPAAVHTSAGPTKVGIIQAQAALLGTKDGQRALSELNKKLDPTKAALEKKANTIRELTDKLQRGGNAMADAAKAELNRNIADLTKAYNRDMEDAQAEADAENRKMFDELTGKITKIIDSYAQANGYTLILNVSDQNTPVLYAANNTDITADVIALYDRTYPVASAPVTTSAPKPAPTTPPAKPATTPVTPKKQP